MTHIVYLFESVEMKHIVYLFVSVETEYHICTITGNIKPLEHENNITDKT